MRAHNFFIFFAALFGLLAVILGAISSHAVEQGIENKAFLTSICEQCRLNAEGAELIIKGTKYQFYHVAALFGVGILSSLHRNYDSTLLKLSGFSFILGIILFSGSLYMLALTGIEGFAKGVPFGGISFMLGWLFLLFYSLAKRKPHE